MAIQVGSLSFRVCRQVCFDGGNHMRSICWPGLFSRMLHLIHWSCELVLTLLLRTPTHSYILEFESNFLHLLSGHPCITHMLFRHFRTHLATRRPLGSASIVCMLGIWCCRGRCHTRLSRRAHGQ